MAIRTLNKRCAKALEILFRPTLHVLGVWAQGALLQLWIGHEDLKKDSATQIEGMMRVLDAVLDRFSCLPLGLHVQADNCCREGKNQYVALWCASLVLLGVFKWVVMAFQRKGHTHDKQDQVILNRFRYFKFPPLLHT